MTGAATVSRESDAVHADMGGTQEPTPGRRPPSQDVSRRRFTIAGVVGALLVLPPLLGLAGDDWTGSVSPLRAVQPDYYYEEQARAMFHGHLYLPQGTL